MVRRVSPAEYKRLIEQQNRKNKKQVDDYNRAEKKRVDDYNRKVNAHNRKVTDEYNRAEKKRVDDYNRQVRQYNSAQRNKRTQLNNAIQKFNQSNKTIVYTSSTILRESTTILEERFSHLSDYTETNELNNSSPILIDYPVQETNNSVQLYNSISGFDSGEYIPPSELQRTVVENNLFQISDELGKRWGGAIYSLNPQNPDAARHFCTSVREIFIKLIDIKAPDENVLLYNSNCELYEGKPNRRSKIKYLLHRKSLEFSALESFIDADIENLLGFFRTLNKGTHGSAGTFDVQQLLKIKKRAEDSIIFISALGN
ncbi:MAG: hypothetical protein P9M11_03695 [Candidatus Tenebribacter burtonii]|jgi:hypothetical protein|nr:hypothetical protein [Candidatus Tenebribacter burtonii]